MVLHSDNFQHSFCCINTRATFQLEKKAVFRIHIILIRIRIRGSASVMMAPGPDTDPYPDPR